jgi:CRISPR-associated exonuclease Cas4
MPDMNDDPVSARDGPPSEPIPISALSHYSYCPRRCALIHLEQTFDENIYTLKGELLHERVHDGDATVDVGLRVERALPLWSGALGLIGKSDVVEHHGETPYPVEYKVGRRRDEPHAPIQLCAQAMCLEEMTGRRVPAGAIYYHASRRRREIVFDATLRAQVRAIAAAVRELLSQGIVPPPPNDARCHHCSLRESCLPRATGEPQRLAGLRRELFTDNDTDVREPPCTNS